LKAPLVSVLMSVYNGEKYLREAIDSILGQTFRNFEFIIIDDGSTDATLKIIQSYNDARIVMISRENKGLVVSLNEGIDIARGKYIARQDADDKSKPQRLSKQIKYLDSHPNCTVVGTYIHEIDDHGGDFYRTVLSNDVVDGSLEIALARYNPLAHGSILMRAETVRRIGGYNIEFWPAEDYELWSRLVIYGRLAVIPEKLYIYRVNTAGISFSNQNLQRKKVTLIQQEVIDRLTFLPNEKYTVSIEDKKYVLKKLLRNPGTTSLVKQIQILTFKQNYKPKVLITSTASSIGGGEVYIQQVIAFLGQKYEFTLLAPKTLIKAIVKDSSLNTIVLPRWLQFLNFRGSFRLKLVWLKTIGIKRFDLVHMQQLDDALSKRMSGIRPIILTAHSRLDFEGEQLNYVSMMLKRVSKVVYVAHVLKPDLDKLSVSKKRLVYIPNGVDGKELLQLPLSRNRKYIVWVGRLEGRDKNPDLFLDVAKLSLKLKLKFKFQIFGDGPLLEMLLNRIENEGLKNVTYQGFQPDKKLIYKYATALCLTSNNEAMPLNILEAFAAAVPVVSTDVGDVKEVLSRGGGIIADKTAISILNTLKEVTAQEGDKYRSFARNNFKQNYQISKTIGNLDIVYSEVLNENIN